MTQYVGALPSGQIVYFDSPEAMAAAGASNPNPIQLAQYAGSKGCNMAQGCATAYQATPPITQATLQQNGSTYNLVQGGQIQPAQVKVAVDPTAQIFNIAGQQVAIGGSVLAGGFFGIQQALSGLGFATRSDSGAQPAYSGNVPVGFARQALDSINSAGRAVQQNATAMFPAFLMPGLSPIAMAAAAGSFVQQTFQMAGAGTASAQRAAAGSPAMTGSQGIPQPQGQTTIAGIASEAARDRPGYYALPGEGAPAARTIGDTRSATLAAGFQALSVFGIGPAFSNRELSTGTALELGRQSSYSRGDVRSAQFYSGEIQKLVSRPIEQASTYHHVASATGIPVPANPWEFRADLSVEFLKGAPQKPSEVFSPISGQMSKNLPGGYLGIQQWSWQAALATDQPGKYARAPDVSYIPGLFALNAAGGEYGPYGTLFGGPAYIGTPSSEGVRKQPDFVFTADARSAVADYLAIAAAEHAGRTVSGIGRYDVSIPADNGAFTPTKKTEMARGPDGNLYPVEFMNADPTGWSRIEGGRLVGTKTVATVPEIASTKTDNTGGYGLPAPFISSSIGKQKPTGAFYDLPSGIRIPIPDFLRPAVAFFQPGKEVTTKLTRTRVPEATTYLGSTAQNTAAGALVTDFYQTTGGTATQTATSERSTSSGFDMWMNNANKAVQVAYRMDKNAPVTTEQVKGWSNILATTPQGSGLGLALKNPVTSDYTAAYVKGAIEGAAARPLDAAVWYGLSIAIMGAFQVAGGGVNVGRSAAAESIISKGGMYRAADIYSGAVMNLAPKALAAVYTVDVAARTTNKGTDISPAAAERFGSISSTELIPMAGGAATFNALFLPKMPASGGPSRAGPSIPESTLGIISPKGELGIPGTSPDFGIQTSKGYQLPFRDMVALTPKGEIILPAPDTVKLVRPSVAMEQRFGSMVSTDVRAPKPGDNPNLRVIDLRENLNLIGSKPDAVIGIVSKPSDVRGITLGDSHVFGNKQAIRYNLNYAATQVQMGIENAFPRASFFGQYAVTRTLPNLARTMGGIPAPGKSGRPMKPFDMEYYAEINKPSAAGNRGYRGFGGSRQVTETPDVVVRSAEDVRFSNAMFDVWRRGPVVGYAGLDLMRAQVSRTEAARTQRRTTVGDVIGVLTPRTAEVATARREKVLPISTIETARKSTSRERADVMPVTIGRIDSILVGSAINSIPDSRLDQTPALKSEIRSIQDTITGQRTDLRQRTDQRITTVPWGGITITTTPNIPTPPLFGGGGGPGGGGRKYYGKFREVLLGINYGGFGASGRGAKLPGLKNARGSGLTSTNVGRAVTGRRPAVPRAKGNLPPMAGGKLPDLESIFGGKKARRRKR